MSLRLLRVLVPAVVVGVVAFGMAVAGGAAPLRAVARSDGPSTTEARCVANLLGFSRKPARPVQGSADLQLAVRFALFRGTRSAADVLPAASHMRQELAAAGAVSYDPSAAVRVAHTGAHAAVYAIPATISPPQVSSACRAALGAAAVAGYQALQSQETGSGAGVCLVSTAVSPQFESGGPLPGAPEPLGVVAADCQSESLLAGYVGSLGEPTGSDVQRALVPDGVGQISYALADGRSFTVPVARNVAVVPPDLSGPLTTPHSTAAGLGRLLAAQLPTTVTEAGTGGTPSVVLTRPTALIPDVANGLLATGRLLGRFGVLGGSSTSGGGASCSARTHRCVAVTVTTNCTSNDRCQTTRTIHRYRYVGTKPPRGTTGPDTQPTAPIVGRTNRLVRRPGKLSLVLSGTAHRHVGVLLSLSCFSKHSSSSAGGLPLSVTVPSRTPIALPGRASAFTACDVGALVISHQRGPVHVTVARG